MGFSLCRGRMACPENAPCLTSWPLLPLYAHGDARFPLQTRGKAPEGQKRFPISKRFLKLSKPGLAGLILAVGLLLLFPVETAMAQATGDVEARNKATVQAGFDAWKNGTGSPYDTLADNATWTIVGNSVVSLLLSIFMIWPTKND
jgi:hypothetical protein